MSPHVEWNTPPRHAEYFMFRFISQHLTTCSPPAAGRVTARDKPLVTTQIICNQETTTATATTRHMTPTNTSLSVMKRTGPLGLVAVMFPAVCSLISHDQCPSPTVTSTGATLHHDNCGLGPRGIFLEQEEIKSFVKPGENVRNPAQASPAQARPGRCGCEGGV